LTLSSEEKKEDSQDEYGDEEGDDADLQMPGDDLRSINMSVLNSNFHNEFVNCNRLFLEEFEELNTNNKENKKLSYTQDISGKKGFTQQKLYE